METTILELLNSLYMFHKFESDVEYHLGDGYQEVTEEETNEKHRLFYWYHHGCFFVNHCIHNMLRHGDEDNSVYEEIEDIIWDFLCNESSIEETMQLLRRYSLN